MRFKLEIEHSMTISYRVSGRVILWLGKSGIISSARYTEIHPLARVFKEIHKDKTLQTINTDVESRISVLILFASLVLL